MTLLTSHILLFTVSIACLIGLSFTEKPDAVDLVFLFVSFWMAIHSTLVVFYMLASVVVPLYLAY